MQEIEQIYTQYRQDVYRYLCSLTRDAALAEDLLSETFLRALTGLSGFRKGACVRTWLFSIARHVWIDGLRRKRHVLSGDSLRMFFGNSCQESVYQRKRTVYAGLFFQHFGRQQRRFPGFQGVTVALYQIEQYASVRHIQYSLTQFRTECDVMQQIKILEV